MGVAGRVCKPGPYDCNNEKLTSFNLWDGFPGSVLSSSPVEPPAALVLLGTAPRGVVVVVPVVGAEPRPLVAGPPRHAALVEARQRVSGRARVPPEGQPVVALQERHRVSV